jgi:hypothetical protein
MWDVNLLERNDKMWMNGRVRWMNLQPDQALMRMIAHTGVSDTTSIAWEDYIHYAWPAPKLSRQEQAHTTYCREGCWWSCIRYEQYSSYNTPYGVSPFNVILKHMFTVVMQPWKFTNKMQNITGLRSKNDELIHSFETDNINPHILRLNEYHMVQQELMHLTIIFIVESCYQATTSENTAG